MQGASHLLKWKGVLLTDCNFFALKPSQQIQQMSLPDEDSALTIFYKLKNLFFDEGHDEEHIANLIRQEPIKTIGNVILLLTKSYNEKLNEIIEPLEEEKYLLLERLREAREQLQHSLEDNEFFKSKIDQLEEQKKQTEEKLNQSIDHFQRSREDIQHEIDEREKIKSEVQIICKQAEEIFTQNSQLKQSNAEYQLQLATIRQEMERIKADNEEMLDINQEIRLKYHQAIRAQNKYCRDIQELQNRLHEREEFIASFIDEYNKVHLFNQESSAKEFHHQEKIEEDNNQLDGFNFNNFDRNSNISEKSLSKNSSLCNLETQMDEKFQFVNATAEKVKPKIPISHTCVTDQKPARKADNKLSSNKQKQMDSKNKNGSNKVEMKKVSSNNKVNKTLIKTVSSKNLKLKESMMVSSSENEGSKMMQEMLKKKMVEKNQKIARLQSEIKHLKEGFIEQRQKVTIMEGEYELQIEQLKEQLAFTKKELSSIYEKYSIVNAECAVYQERYQELEDEVVVMQEEHRSYCEELKRRCKEYVLKKIDQVENQYRNIKGEIKKQSAERAEKNDQSEYHNESNDKLQYSIQSQQGIPQQFHLDLKQAPDELVKIDSFSQIQSYQKLSNHYFNGFELEFSSKMSNMQPNHEQIYVQEQFDIESNLGRFTERLISGKKQGKLMREKVSLTDRCSLQTQLIDAIYNQAESSQVLRLDCQVYEINLDAIQKQLNYASNLCQCLISPRRKFLSLFHISPVSYTPQKISKCLKLDRYIDVFTFQPVISELSLHQVTAFTFEPSFSLGFKSSIIQEMYVPSERRLQMISKNLQISIQRQKFLKLIPHQFFHIASPIKQLRVFHQILSYKIASCKHLTASSMQTDKQSKQQREVQKTVNNQSVIVQTVLIQMIENASQVSLSLIENNCQTDHKSFFSQQTQTERQYKLSKKLTFGPQVISLQLQSSSPASKTMQYTVNPHQIAILQPSFCPFSLFSTPTTLTSQKSSLLKQPKKQIAQKSCYEISQHSFQHQSIVHQESSYSETVSEIILKPLQENLSTKNDELVGGSKLNEISGKNVNIVYEASEKKRRSAERRMSDFFAEVDHSNSYSILNNGVLLSQNNETKEGKTFNPQSKSYRNQRVNQTQISISPWFVDQKREEDQYNSAIKTLPVEVYSQLSKEQTYNLQKYLTKHKLKLSFYNQIQKQAFKKPSDIKKKIYLIFASKNNQREVFMISSTRIQNIRNNQYIKFQSNNVVDHVNFLFGQSEVMITGDSYLIVHRNGKKNKLLGSIQDGKWAIEFYITCTYQKME